MATLTPNLGLKKFDETDYVDFEDINDNYDLLDTANACYSVTSGTGTYTNGSSGVAAWWIKSFANNVRELTTRLAFTNQASGSTATYAFGGYSYFPLDLSTVQVPVTLASGASVWIQSSDPRFIITGSLSGTTLTLTAYCLAASITSSSLNVDICLKGVVT